MPTGTITVNMNIAGVSFAKTVTRTVDGNIGAQATIPKALAGTLSTRTDNDTGVLTVASGHGITTSDLVTVAWSGGRRYAVTVTGTTSTTISIDAGSGDNLPSQSTAITVSKEVVVNVDFPGDGLLLFGFMASKTCLLQTFDPSDVSAGRWDLIADEPLVGWYTSGKTTMSEFFDALEEVGSFRVSNLDTSADCTFYFGAMFDATP